MGFFDGLCCGLDVKDFEYLIEVLVGKVILGCIMNVLGELVDMKGEIGEEECWVIYCVVFFYEELLNFQELLEIGIKVIDLMCLFVKGGKVGLFGGVGVGKIVNMMEFICNIVIEYFGYFVFVGVGECICEGNDFYYEMIDFNVIDKVFLVYGQMNELLGNCLCVVLIGLIMVEKFCDEGCDVLLFVDNIYCYILVGMEVFVLLGCMFLVVGYQLILVEEMGVLQECIIFIKIGFIIFVQVVYVFVDDLIDLFSVIIFVYFDVIVVLSCQIVFLGIYLVVDLLDFISCQLDLLVVGQEYYDIVCGVQFIL